MADFIPYDRRQQLLLPIDLAERVPEDDLAHFIIEAVEHVAIGAFKVAWAGTGTAPYHPRMMLALLIYCTAGGILSSRRIGRATYRDIGVRFIAADRHPDHATIAEFRRDHREAFEAAFKAVLLMAGELGLLRLGTISIDGSKDGADASKVRSVRDDRAPALADRIDRDIAELLARAEAADAEDAADPQALLEAIGRRQALRDELAAAAARLEAAARERAAADEAADEERLAAHEARNRRGRAPKPPDTAPRPDGEVNLTDPDR